MVQLGRLGMYGWVFSVFVMFLVLNELCFVWSEEGIANRRMRLDPMAHLDTHPANLQDPGSEDIGSSGDIGSDSDEEDAGDSTTRREPIWEVLEEILSKTWRVPGGPAVDGNFIEECKKLSTVGARPHHTGPVIEEGDEKGGFFEVHLCKKFFPSLFGGW